MRHGFPRDSFARPLLMLALAGALPLPAAALDAACVQAVTQANLKMIDAPAFHQEKHFGSSSLELLKVDGKLYRRQGSGAWAAAPLSVQALREGAKAAASMVAGCARDGTGTVDGIATDIYRLDITGPGAQPIGTRVWIGSRDGLPYREEGGTVKSTTHYSGIKAPL